MSECIEFEIGDDSVFADLDLPDANDLLTKAGLVGAILRASKEQGLIQSETAKRSGITEVVQPFARKSEGYLHRETNGGCGASRRPG